jgi:hypothetical protein
MSLAESNRWYCIKMRSYISQRNTHLLIALIIALAYHGALLLSGTFTRTYDAYVHIFFADHYQRAWFDHWEYRWYTGFPVTSYPPGTHQAIALLAPLLGLQRGFMVVQLFAVLLVVVGVYRFSKLWVSEEAAGYAALLTVFSSSIAETVHVFGQLPTMFSLGFLLNALPYVQQWLRTCDWKMLLAAWAINAATTAGHHVTTLFGAVFFVGPVIVSVIVDYVRQPLPDEPDHELMQVTRGNLRALVMRRLRRIIPVVGRSALYGGGLISLLVFVVLPYWLWSRSDPIKQVPIPHSSRDSFLQNPSAGLMFWLIPYGVSLIALPYVFTKALTTRIWPLGLSLALLFFLGTGGTTPFPKMLLGGAYDILTLDRFTFWATIAMLPLLGAFVASLRHGPIARQFQRYGTYWLRVAQVGLMLAYLLFSVLTVNFTQFRSLQPASIDMQPIVDFLEKDQHYRWRYLTLGFGDQMAWLSAQTRATSVDGNYHSARRLPELTSTPVERLEGAKFRGVPGIGSLEQFVTIPEKYNLKYIFSNDQFYDPLLFFSGWHRVQRLENGIMVWEREDIPPLPDVLPRREIPVYQRVMWGIVPMSAIVLAAFALTMTIWLPGLRKLTSLLMSSRKRRIWLLPSALRRLNGGWQRIDARIRRWSELPTDDRSAPAAIVSAASIWSRWRERLRLSMPAKRTLSGPWSIAIIVFGLLIGLGIGLRNSQAQGAAHPAIAVVQAYYDDLDFRRFLQAYNRLDPTTRPNYDQYRLDLSVQAGLLASYAKLDAVQATPRSVEPDRVVVDAVTSWVTSVAEYPHRVEHTLVRRGGQWYLLPEQVDVTVPPEQFFRRGEVEFRSQGRRRVTTEATSFGDVLDRPELQILSARLVARSGRYSVVGEVLNTDADPGDVTVIAFLYDDKGNLLGQSNAQTAIIHKLFPKEATPFRIDFEGVAGEITATPATFQVYAKGVVTERDLERDVAAQNVRFASLSDGRMQLVGELFNVGTHEAIIPHLMVTYYDRNNRVVWVDDVFLEQSVRPQRALPFEFMLPESGAITTVLETGQLFPRTIQSGITKNTDWLQRTTAPPNPDYATVRISVNYMPGASQ